MKEQIEQIQAFCSGAFPLCLLLWYNFVAFLLFYNTNSTNINYKLPCKDVVKSTVSLSYLKQLLSLHEYIINLIVFINLCSALTFSFFSFFSIKCYFFEHVKHLYTSKIKTF